MSTTGTSTGVPAGARAASAKTTRLRHTPGGVKLGQEAGHAAQRLAAVILEVLGGVRTPGQAAQALGISLPRYFQVETRAVQALVASCAPRPRGPGRSAEREVSALRRQQERLQRELSRQQTLVRLAQRSLGLPPPKAPAPPSAGKGSSKRRRRRPVVRALRAAEVLHQRSQETEAEEARNQAAAAPPPGHEGG